MQRVVGYGIVALVAGYVLWLAFSGTPFGKWETVIINTSSAASDDAKGPNGANAANGTNGNTGNADSSAELELNIVTLLGFDGIPSIENPQFVEPEVADETYDPDELVLGVEINGDARAYSVPLLSRHEIVNDVVGGKPIAVTW
jgi:hypothetical protein